jgi:hypothetical protein
LFQQGFFEGDHRGMSESMSTHAKALDINLDPGRFGTFAEIGAGQEVGRWFFRVGAAAGTIAKTISAYDKTVSDAIYGTSARYVSAGRLQAMLDYEYDLLVDRLDSDRGAESCFFAFADTVQAQNFRGDADCHGWMGIRFQTGPRAESSQIMLHARMVDREPLSQYEALGVLGVNLIYGAARLSDQPEALLASLLDNLGSRRIEIDMVEFSGAAFRDIDHRVMSLCLVENGLSRAAMFSASGAVLRPSEVLYKRPVVLQRGRFRPPTKVHSDIQRRVLEKFCADAEVAESEVVSLLGISVTELREAQGSGLEDFLHRLDALTAGNQAVLITDYPEEYLVVEYLKRYKASKIALPLGIPSFLEIVSEESYAGLSGGFLEAAGRFFRLDVWVYVYPGLDPTTGERLELDNVEIPSETQPIFTYLRQKGLVKALDGLPDEQLRVRSDDVLAWLREGNPKWESYVEPAVAKAIREGGLFGYRASGS